MTDDQFYRVMHEGIGMHGEYLYPVFPFPWFTHVTKDDDLAIKAYLFSLKPVHAPQVVNHLAFPFNVRESLLGWRQVFFKPQTFEPDPAKSAKINRGAYLVTGLGHCAECHTPHDPLGASEQSKSFAGAKIDEWYAPNISSDMSDGIGSWSEDQLVEYLKTGVTPAKGIVAGPMAQVVHESLSKLTDDDVHAIAAYLKQTPPKQSYPQVTPVSATQGNPPVGAGTYLSFCASCHQQTGKGVPGAIASLDGNGSVQAGGPEDVIAVVLGGLPASGSYAAMPGVGAQMSDQQVADVVNYVRTAWSNHAPPNAAPGLVGSIRAKTATEMSGGPCAPYPAAFADQKTGLPELFAGLNEGNMFERIDSIVTKAKAAEPQAPQAKLVNDTIAAYCPVLKADNSVPANLKEQQLGSFAGLLYGRINPAPGGQN
jgi:mono/diheme cytochrome c family protein